MRTALLLSGRFRAYEQAKPELAKLINRLNPDIYCHFWRENDFSDFCSFVKPKEMIVSEEPSIDEISFVQDRSINVWEGVRPLNVYKMYKSLFKVYSILSYEGWQNYDFLIRARLDLIYGEKKQFDPFDENAITISGWWSNCGYGDVFALGPPELMYVYFTTLFHLKTAKMYHPEIMLKDWLDLHKIPVVIGQPLGHIDIIVDQERILSAEAQARADKEKEERLKAGR